MGSTKIHCDILDIWGPDWSSFDDGMAERLIENIQQMEMLGADKELFGFVETRSVGNVVGGFITIQYMTSLLNYDRQKNQSKKDEFPFEKLVFLLFAKTGKLVLQNRKFADHPLSMEIVHDRMREALAVALFRTNKSVVTSISLSEKKAVSKEEFIRIYQDADIVSEITVIDLDPQAIPPGIIYFNPKFDANALVQESHQIDYAGFSRIELEAKANHDLKNTHTGKDVMYAGTPVKLTGKKGSQPINVVRNIPIKLELSLEIPNLTFTDESMLDFIELIRKAGHPIDLPPTKRKSKRQNTEQLSMFADESSEDIDEN